MGISSAAKVNWVIGGVCLIVGAVAGLIVGGRRSFSCDKENCKDHPKNKTKQKSVGTTS